MTKKGIKGYFSKGELLLWGCSLLFITLAFCIWDGENYLTLVASLIGATALIFNAKGNPLGQVFIIVFAILYSIISWTCAYYGEMITYLGMTTPMALFAFINWMRHPYDKNKAEVKINRLHAKDLLLGLALTAVVTIAFYFILRALNTNKLIPSTISVATSFLAMYFSARRSPYFALAYALNDVVLIVLWLLATVEDLSYLSVIICFLTFLVNDCYSFCNWLRMEKRQSKKE